MGRLFCATCLAGQGAAFRWYQAKLHECGREAVLGRPVKVIALLKAEPGMSRKAFRKRWVEDHAPLALRMDRLRGYRINVAIEEQEIEGELPYDGTAELWWDSVEDMHADFESESGIFAGEDADSFTVIRQHIYTEEHVLR